MLDRTFAKLIIAVTLAVSPASAMAQRMPDTEGQRLMLNREKIAPPRVTLDHPAVVFIEVEDAHVNLSPHALDRTPGPKFFAKTTINVITSEPLSEREIDTLAASVREQASYFHVVGVGFSLQSSPAGRYGWHLFWDGRDTIRSITGSKEQISRAGQGALSSLAADERLIGTWVNPGTFPGAFSLTVRANRLWLLNTFSDGSGGRDRTRLRIANDGLLVGVYQISDLGTFKTDGVETDRVSVRFVGDRLHVSDDTTGSAPWFIGSPTTKVDRSLIPSIEPTTSSGGYSRKDFAGLDDALECVQRADRKHPMPKHANDVRRQLAVRDAQLRQAYRLCFSKKDIERLGALAEIIANAHTSCGKTLSEPYIGTRVASQVIWAALVADEVSHIDARYRHPEESVVRGSSEAAKFCSDLLARFGPGGTEVAGVIAER